MKPIAIVRAQYAAQAAKLCTEQSDKPYTGGFRIEPQRGRAMVVQVDDRHICLWYDAAGWAHSSVFVRLSKDLAQDLATPKAEKKRGQARYLVIMRDNTTAVAEIRRGPWIKTGQPYGADPIRMDQLDRLSVVASEELDIYVPEYPAWRERIPRQYQVEEIPAAVAAADGAAMAGIVPDTVSNPAIVFGNVRKYPFTIAWIPSYPEFHGLLVSQKVVNIPTDRPQWLQDLRLTHSAQERRKDEHLD